MPMLTADGRITTDAWSVNSRKTMPPTIGPGGGTSLASSDWQLSIASLDAGTGGTPMTIRGSGHGSCTGCVEESLTVVTRPELAICCGACCTTGGVNAAVAPAATGVWADEGVAPAAVLGSTLPGVAVVITTRTTPVGGAAGVINSTADTGVTTVPIGAGVGVTRSATGGTGLGWQPGPRLAI